MSMLIPILLVTVVAPLLVTALVLGGLHLTHHLPLREDAMWSEKPQRMFGGLELVAVILLLPLVYIFLIMAITI